MEESFRGPLSRDEGVVALIKIGRDQAGGVGIGACQQDCRHTQHISSKACRAQFCDRFLGRHKHLAAHMAAFLRRRELVFEVHTRSARADHAFHQFECVEIAAEPGLGVRHDWRQPVDTAVAVQGVNLVGTQKGVVDSFDHFRHRIGRIQALVRVHLAGAIGVPGYLPTRAVNGFEACLDLLDRLVAGQRTERAQRLILVNQAP